MTEQTQDHPPQSPPHPPLPEARSGLYLADDPARIAAYLKERKNRIKAEDTPGNADSLPSFSFADFVNEMNRTDFEDPYQIRAILESQAHLLGMVFEYLILEGDWENLAFALRSQKIMRDTIGMMNSYPQLSYSPFFKTAEDHAQNMD